MIIPPDIQAEVAKLIEERNRLARQNAAQQKRIEQLLKQTRQQQQQTWHQKDRADEAQARERRAWQDAERVFG